MFESLRKIEFLSVFAIKTSLLQGLLISKTLLLITSSQQVQVSAIVSLRSLLEVEVSNLSCLLKFLSALLQLEEIVVSSLNTLVAISVLTLLTGNDVPKTIHVALVTLTLFLELLELEAGTIDILAE